MSATTGDNYEPPELAQMAEAIRLSVEERELHPCHACIDAAEVAADPCPRHPRCKWFLLCIRPADGLADAGPLGLVPCCTRCAEVVGAELIACTP